MRKNAFSIVLIVFFILLLAFPDASKNGALEGLSLWYNSVVPILFPFLILSNLMVSNHSFQLLLSPFFCMNHNHAFWNPWYFYALILGFFCGYPMGAKAISDLVNAKKISTYEGSILLPLVNQASPMFLAGYLGIHIFENKIPVSKIMFYIYLPPLILFFLFLLLGKFLKKQDLIYPPSNQKKMDKKNSMSHSMEHTIWNSFSILVTIGAYMMVFTIICNLCHVLLPQSPVFSVASCFLEFSSGINRLKQLSYLPNPLKNSLILSLTSFGGCCTAVQTYSVLENTEVSFRTYLCIKILLAGFVFFLVYSSSISS